MLTKNGIVNFMDERIPHWDSQEGLMGNSGSSPQESVGYSSDADRDLDDNIWIRLQAQQNVGDQQALHASDQQDFLDSTK